MDDPNEPQETARGETRIASDGHGPLSDGEFNKMLAEMDQQAIVEERELLRELEENQRPKWWTFGIRTYIP